MPIPMFNYPNFRPYSNVQPFTVRDGATYLMTLEGLRDWIRDTLVPHLDSEIEGLTGSWESNVTDVITQFEQISAALIQTANELAEGSSESAAAAEAARIAAEAARDMAAVYASSAENIQDSAITSIFNNATSAFRNAFNAVVATLIVEDVSDPGTFIVNNPDSAPTPANVMTDPNDPGFWIEDK